MFDKLRKRGMSRIEPALLILDGHGLQLQRELMVVVLSDGAGRAVVLRDGAGRAAGVAVLERQ